MKKRSQFHCTSRRQKFDFFYQKFSSQFNELSLKFQKQQKVAKKWLKLKHSRKPHLCGIRGVRVKRMEKISQLAHGEQNLTA